MTNSTLWQAKLLARIHDPAEKSIILMNTPEGHEGGTVAALKKQLFSQAQLRKLLLMLLASSNLTPVAPVFDCLSEPAKSTILNLESIIFPPPVSL